MRRDDDPTLTRPSTWKPPQDVRSSEEQARDRELLDNVVSLIHSGNTLRPVVEGYLRRVAAEAAIDAFGGGFEETFGRFVNEHPTIAKLAREELLRDDRRRDTQAGTAEYLNGEVATAAAEVGRGWVGSLLYAKQLSGQAGNRILLEPVLLPKLDEHPFLEHREKWIAYRRKSFNSLFSSVALDRDGLANVMETLAADAQRRYGATSFELPYGMQIRWPQHTPVLESRRST